MSLTSQHLLALKPSGNEVRDLEQFRDKVLYVLSGLEEDDQLSEGMLRSWLYESLKRIPFMQMKIERFREAPAGDPIRSFEWLWGKLGEALDEAQHDLNSSSIMASHSLESPYQTQRCRKKTRIRRKRKQKAKIRKEKSTRRKK